MRHLDEGEIHAWLDGAVASDEATRIEAHIAACATCAAEVATARGLIAGASRILLALDSVPGGVIPVRSSNSAGTAIAGAAQADRVASNAADDLARQRTKTTERRHVPWFSRPWTRIAAGLVLAAGIGTVAARRDVDGSNRVTIELRTESAADAREPLPAAVPAADAFGVGSGAGAGIGSVAAGSATASGTPSTGTTATAGAPVRAAVSLPAPVAQRGATAVGERTAAVRDRAAGQAPQAGAANAASAVAEQTAVAAADMALKARQASAPAVTPPPPAPTAPPVVASAREESRAQAERAGGGGGAGGAVAGARASQQPDSARRLNQTLRLSEVVVTGVTEPTSSVRMGFAVSRASLAGSCYALELGPMANVPRGEMELPRTMRIRLADLQNIATDAVRAETRGADLLGDSLAQRRTLARPALAQAAAAASRVPEPLETVEWESTARDSVVARRLVGIDVIVLRLGIAGDVVSGTATAQTATTPPVPVTGRRISCDGSF